MANNTRPELDCIVAEFFIDNDHVFSGVLELESSGSVFVPGGVHALRGRSFAAEPEEGAARYRAATPGMVLPATRLSA